MHEKLGDPFNAGFYLEYVLLYRVFDTEAMDPFNIHPPRFNIHPPLFSPPYRRGSSSWQFIRKAEQEDGGAEVG